MKRILLGALLTAFVAALLGLWSGGIGGALLVGFAVAISANAGKQAFDSIVQRDAPTQTMGDRSHVLKPDSNYFG